jgi:hypothetical protein
LKVLLVHNFIAMSNVMVLKKIIFIFNYPYRQH